MKFHRGRPPLPQRPEGWGSWRLLSRWRCHKASLQAGARAIPKRAWWRHPFPIINFAQDGERARQGRCQAHLLLGEAGAPTQEGQGHWLWDAGMNTRVCIRKRRHSHESPTATKCHLPYVKVFWSPGTVGGPPWWTTGRPAVLVLLARGVFLVGARYKMVAFTDVTVLACVQVEMGNKRNHKGQKARAARTLPRYDGRSRSRL
jgi:hypothetical protein